MKATYKIVFYKSPRSRSINREVVEIASFECNDPLKACAGYIQEILKADHTYVTAKVYPPDTTPIMEAFTAAAAPTEKSSLFTGYEKKPECCGGKCHKPTANCNGRVMLGFSCTASTWLDRVELLDSGCMKVYFLNGGNSVCYTAPDIDSEFYAFKAWVDMGKSAGNYYNTNIKGKLDTLIA
jgi:hypothetical protein